MIKLIRFYLTSMTLSSSLSQ